MTDHSSSRLDTYLGGLLARHRWVVYVVPMVVFMLALQVKADGKWLAESWYPVVYAVTIAVVIALMLVLLPAYRQHPLRVSPLSLGVGLVGGVLWIAVAKFEAVVWRVLRDGLFKWQALAEFLEDRGWFDAGEASARAAFNPFDELAHEPVLMIAFIAVRLVGLAIVVPIIEEFFLRGFLMRFVIDNDWWQVPIGKITHAAVLACLMYAALSHPELLAALLWFSLVTWLAARTNNIWDAVAAHAVTNLMLGIWVLYSGDWWLW